MPKPNYNKSNKTASTKKVGAVHLNKDLETNNKNNNIIEEVTEEITEEVIKEIPKEVIEPVKEEPLTDDTIVNCISQVPNLSYVDNDNNFYEWVNVGDVQELTYRQLKHIKRNHKVYIDNLLFVFEDKQVIKAFRLEQSYNNYLKFKNADYYTASNVNGIKEELKKLPRGIVDSIMTGIKSMVKNNEINDVSIILRLENDLNLELIKYLGKK